MQYITENDVLEAFIYDELSEEDMIDLYNEGYISENTMEYLIQEGVLGATGNYALTALKKPVKWVPKMAYTLPAVGAGGIAGALAGAGAGAALMGPAGLGIGGALGVKYGTIGGAGIGGLLGASVGHSLANDEGYERFSAKVDNWAHDKHFRDHHRRNLVAALKKGKTKLADKHRSAMFMHQDRMKNKLEQHKGSKFDMKHYDRDGKLVKDIDAFYR